MARIKNQASFEDVPFMNKEIVEHIEAVLENKAAVKDYRRADRAIKDILPDVDGPTRFNVGERYIIEVNPYEVDGHEVTGGKRRRVRVAERGAS